MKAFINHFTEFIDDVERVFPEDKDIQTTKNALFLIKKTNPKMLIEVWHTCVGLPYEVKITEGDIGFFIDKDYNRDLDGFDNSVMDKVDRLRGPIREMGKENQEKAMKYIQNLTKLAKVYNEL